MCDIAPFLLDDDNFVNDNDVKEIVHNIIFQHPVALKYQLLYQCEKYVDRSNTCSVVNMNSD
jgi:hypothetical protein